MTANTIACAPSTECPLVSLEKLELEKIATPRPNYSVECGSRRVEDNCNFWKEMGKRLALDLFMRESYTKAKI
jgi:hypothetical protein